MSQFDNLDVYKLAERRYGVKNVSEFPGPQLTNINKFRDFCFETAAEFVDQDKEIQNTSEGQKCESAVIKQMSLYGKEKPDNRFRLPVILSKPQYFKDAYLKTGNIEEAYRIAANSCISNGNPGFEQSTCIKRVANARDAMIRSQSGVSDLNKVDDFMEAFPEDDMIRSQSGVSDLNKVEAFPEDIVEAFPEEFGEDNVETYDERYSTKSGNKMCRNIILTIVLVVGLLCLLMLMINKTDKMNKLE